MPTKLQRPIRISRLAFVEGNSHYGRGNSEAQIKETAEFEEQCREQEAKLNRLPQEPPR